ncbi:MAG: type III pantothenate kinase [Bacteroidota bacterium]|nr:type III pantothenate kinase [Bacteroidota bacterium]
MKLVIDIGNTRTKLALFEGKDVFARSNINECRLKSLQEFVSNKDVSATIISSVKEINSEILSILDYYKGFILSKNTPVPIKNNYKTPNTLGKDRLVAVIGALYLYPKKDIIVFDAGTCLTIDFVSAKGEYIGGRISPGIEMRYKALHTFTDKLPLVQKEKTTSIIGDDTTSSISSGVQQGILAEVNSIISEYRSKNPDTVVVITGGDSFFFEKELKNGIFANPNLVLVGLNEILDFNE